MSMTLKSPTIMKLLAVPLLALAVSEAMAGEQKTSVVADVHSANLASPERPERASSSASGDYVVVIDQDMRALAGEIARKNGLTPEVAPDVRQRVTNVQLPTAPQEFLARLQSLYGIYGAVDGGRLVIYGKSPVVSRLLPLGDVSYERLKAQIAAASITINEGAVKRLAESNAVLVTAPASVVAQVSGILDTMVASGSGVRVIRYGAARVEKPR